MGQRPGRWEMTLTMPTATQPPHRDGSLIPTGAPEASQGGWAGTKPNLWLTSWAYLPLRRLGFGGWYALLAACAPILPRRALAAADLQQINALWRLANDPVTYAEMHLCLTCLVRGDLDGAAALLARSTHRAEQLGFPRGPYSLAYAWSLEGWMHIEAGQLDRAAVLADDISRLAERYGFDLWRLDADICRAAVNGLAALGAQDQRKTDLAVHIATLTTRLDTARRLGITRFGAFYDAILGRLLIAAGHPETAHARLDASLHSARDTGIRFYDAELLRLRAQTHGDRAARQADIDAALEVSRRQGATLFELRAALDDYDHRGEPARTALLDIVGRMPTGSTLPEITHARAALG